jgi:hypothetical protein
VEWHTPRTQEAEARGSQVLGQLGLQNESQKNKQKQKQNKKRSA